MRKKNYYFERVRLREITSISFSHIRNGEDPTEKNEVEKEVTINSADKRLGHDPSRERTSKRCRSVGSRGRG
jgi:hypothetical protein